MEGDRTDSLKLLAVFAHPDDESYGIGGTLAKCADEGIEVHLLCATRGEAGSTGDPPLCRQEELGCVREAELRKACEILGVRGLTLLDYIDGRVKYTDRREAVGKIIRAMRKIKPQVIVTFGPDGIYGHPDHIAIGSYATEAFHASGKRASFTKHFEEGLAPHQPLKLYYTAVPRSFVEWAKGVLPNADRFIGMDDDDITLKVDLGKYIEAKLSAIRCHRTQLNLLNRLEKIKSGIRERFGREHFVRAASYIPGLPQKERDLFEGINQIKL
ncbi:MAG: PIG-L deacetylase family protein [bacterium]